MPSWIPDYLPIYGFGFMLCLAFIMCTWLTSRRAEREGVAKEHIQDLALWVFLGGIICARITFMIQYGRPITEFFNIWQGGLVFYGSAVGGLLGYLGAYYFILRKYNLSTWKMADMRESPDTKNAVEIVSVIDLTDSIDGEGQIEYECRVESRKDKESHQAKAEHEF